MSNDANQKKPPPMEDIAAKAIREAMERGEFNNLAGRGKPLNLWGDLADRKTMASKLRRNANFGTPWTDLGAEIDRDVAQFEHDVRRAHAWRVAGLAAARADVDKVEAEWLRGLARFEDQVRAINSKILKLNLIIPPQLPQLHRVRIKLDEVLAGLEVVVGDEADSG